MDTQTMVDVDGELAPPPPPSTATKRSAREANTIAPAPERARVANAPESPKRDAPEVGEPGGPSHRPGDVPTSLTRRYFTEALRGGATLAFYEGPGANTPSFHDHGNRLSTEQTHPDLVRDLTGIAAHRGWRSIQVRGEDGFRREVWMEARALGLEVKGYKPRERDQQELDRRLEAVRVKRPTEPKSVRERPEDAERTVGEMSTRGRPDFDVGISGILLTSGEAPYRRRTGEAVTPFIRVDRGDGRALDIWGVGLPDALSRSGAAAGDAIRVRRDGVEVVQKTIEVRDPKTGDVAKQVREVGRNRWVIEAERFRQASPSQAARDPDLRGAQSHLAVVNTVIDQAIRDPEQRQRLRAEARDLVAEELAQGRRFGPARIREIEPVLARDLAETRAREATPERIHRR